MRFKTPFALGGLLIVALGGLIGFAAFSTDADPIPTTIVSGRLPAQADGRIAAAAFVAMMRSTPTAPPVETPTPPPATTAPAPPSTTVAPTTAPPPPTETANAAATTTRPPAPPPPPTTTTTVPPASPTTTATTTVPPADIDDAVEVWRPLVEQYFPPERVGEALQVMWCESRGNPTVVNDVSGAAGLFQFVPTTWAWASAEAGWTGASVLDPEANIASAAWLVQVSIDTDHAGGAWGHWSCQP